MEAEPGYVVVGASRSWGRWDFRGLKDPMARDARTVLAAAGLAPPTIDGQFKRYVSLDSAMIVARARQKLGVPTTTTMALLADTLRLGGSASMGWLRQVRDAPAIIGVAHVDASAVQPTLAAGMAALKHDVDATRVLFDAGSSSVKESEVASLRELSGTMRRLLDSASAIGAALRVDLIGRTDPTGSDATNRSLAELRIDAVAQRLSALGVPSALLHARPVATSQPLRGATADESARINRSVSFEVVVTSEPQAPRGP
jgi:OOP family OmpA-OmpF porin